MWLRGGSPFCALITFDMSFRLPNDQENIPIYMHDQLQPDHIPAVVSLTASRDNEARDGRIHSCLDEYESFTTFWERA